MYGALAEIAPAWQADAILALDHARHDFSTWKAAHFDWSLTDGVGATTLYRPARKNPLTFESYAELRDLFRALGRAEDVRAVVITGAGANFCSGAMCMTLLVRWLPCSVLEICRGCSISSI